MPTVPAVPAVPRAPLSCRNARDSSGTALSPLSPRAQHHAPARSLSRVSDHWTELKHFGAPARHRLLSPTPLVFQLVSSGPLLWRQRGRVPGVEDAVGR